MFSTNDKALLEAGAQVILKAQHELDSITIDSREVSDRIGFLAMPGTQADGNDFVCSAIKAGAPLIIMTRDVHEDELKLALEHEVALYQTADGLLFLDKLARLYLEELDALVVGITGSVGKTSTKQMFLALASKKYKAHANRGNFNNNIGLPLTILSAPRDTEVLILEMGMNALGEIEYLSKLAHPSIAAITQIGLAHIGMLGSQDAIAQAKSEILLGMKPYTAKAIPSLKSKMAVILNANDPYSSYLKAQAKNLGITPYLTYADAPELDLVPQSSTFDLSNQYASQDIFVKASSLELNELAQAEFNYELQARTGKSRVRLGLAGMHNVSNALLALAFAHLLDLSDEDIIDALASLEAEGGRQRLVKLKGGGRLIDDAYNASPASMAASIATLASIQTNGKKLAVLGDMKELGKNERTYHYEIGTLVAGNKIDVLIAVGELSKAMAQGALDAGMDANNVYHVIKPSEALELLLALLKVDDIALIKASHSTGLDLVVEGIE
ncbi:MAG: UDP-N-acetylmuramoyl-tripeptide--D-alanyl-D-alanine ligase [Coriobacteriia bacterium]|nr:UDP-N-acetylmuramoyl-tripeptide--D-alanyl-D-alanine ligase [Coriobacteriia bacterium]